MARRSTFELVYPPWAFARDDGAELERIHGEVGLDGLVAPVVTGPAAALQALAAENALFVSEGGWHFHAQSEHYRGSGLRARAASWMGRRDHVGAMAEFAGRHGLSLTLRIAATEIPALLHAEPNLCTHSAWDGGALTRRACPCNPSFRALIGDICGDLARFSPAAFELGDCELDQPLDDTSMPELLRGIAGLAELVAICFCPACREIGERAGVDVDAARRSTRVHAERSARLPPDERAVQGLSDDSELQRYLSARCADQAGWLARFAERLEPRQLRVLTQSHSSGHPDAQAILVSVAQLGAEWRDGLRDAPAETAQRIAATHVGACIPIARPCFLAADELVRAVHPFSEAVRVLELAGAETSPGEAVGWLRQALRYARRS